MIPADAKGTIREIVLPKGLDLDRPKRTRTSFTAEQLYRLEMEFQRCQYVVGRERTELARQLNLSETQVKGQGQATPLLPWQPGNSSGYEACRLLQGDPALKFRQTLRKGLKRQVNQSR